MKRQELLQKKASLIEENNQIKRQISEAISLKRTAGVLTNPKDFSDLYLRKSELGSEISKIDFMLSQSRAEKSNNIRNDDLTFERAFMRKAKFILTGSQYEEIIRATNSDLEGGV